MNTESKAVFVSFCIEQYAKAKNMSTEDVVNLFEQYGIAEHFRNHTVMSAKITQDNLYMLLPLKIGWLAPWLSEDKGISLTDAINRIYDEDINVTFMNNDKAQEFVITVWREESNEVGNEVHDKSNQVEDLDTGLRYSNTDLDTGLRHSDTDLDTGLRHSDTDLDTQLRHSDTPKVSLSNKQRDIVNFCSVPRTTKEILDRIGVSMHSKNRERYITSLVAAGYLQMTNPDNPTASNQKYKKVNKR